MGLSLYRLNDHERAAEPQGEKLKVGIIGGGLAGLAAARELAKNGVKIQLYEKSPALGGLASSFLLDNAFIERYYHFICRRDFPLFALLEELGLESRLRWVKTRMGLYYNGRLYPFGSPADLFCFPHLSISEKLKFGFALVEIKSKKADAWKAIESTPAAEWLVSKFGRRIYGILHEPLVRLKFGSYASRLSAAWMWARIHRVGKSRSKITQKEILGYIEGGTKILLDRLEQEIIRWGGEILASTPVSGIDISPNSSVRGIRTGSQAVELDALLSTVPSPVFLSLLPKLQGTFWENLRRIDSIGVICVLLKVRKSFSEFFWLNISDRRVPLAGVIEYTNLNRGVFSSGGYIIYLPQYLPSSDERFRWDDQKIISHYAGYLNLIKPDFRERDIDSAYVFRDEYAQPICEVGFSRTLPKIKTPVEGLYITDSSLLHPDDRTIANSIDLGMKAARMILADFPKGR